MYFSKKVYAVYNICVKRNLTVCKVTFLTVSYRKMGEHDVLVAAPIILLGEQLVPGSGACGSARRGVKPITVHVDNSQVT